MSRSGRTDCRPAGRADMAVHGGDDPVDDELADPGLAGRQQRADEGAGGHGEGRGRVRLPDDCEGAPNVDKGIGQLDAALGEPGGQTPLAG